MLTRGSIETVIFDQRRMWLRGKEQKFEMDSRRVFFCLVALLSPLPQTAMVPSPTYQDDEDAVFTRPTEDQIRLASEFSYFSSLEEREGRRRNGGKRGGKERPSQVVVLFRGGLFLGDM